MKRGITFKPFLAHKIISGQKTQTRRMMYPQPELISSVLPAVPCKIDEFVAAAKKATKRGLKNIISTGALAGYLAPDMPFADTICLLEDYRIINIVLPFTVTVEYRDGKKRLIDLPPDKIKLIQKRKTNGGWRPARFMFLEFARHEIKITGYRAEKLGDISEDDAIQEGIMNTESGWVDYMDDGYNTFEKATDSFKSLWTHIHGEYSPNVWVWAIDFQLIKK